MIRIQAVVQILITAMPIPQDTDTLPRLAQTAHIIGGRRMAAGVSAGTESNAAGTEPDAAVAAMEKMASHAENLL